PLSYVAVFALILRGVWWHATTNTHLFEDPHGLILGKLIYAAPIVGSLALVSLMLKPLVAPRPRHVPPVRLMDGEEPLLQAFIAALSRAVGARPPDHIELDFTVNAAVGLRRSGQGIFASVSDLRIGLPLVQDLDLPRFAGVMAHEIVHLDQSLDMRLWKGLHAIYSWFWHVAYTRDAWDDAIDRGTRSSSAIVVFLAWTTATLVLIVRALLRAIACISRLAVCAHSRQMEFEADRAAMQVAGSQRFVDCFCRLAALEHAAALVTDELTKGWAQRCLPRNYGERLERTRRGFTKDELSALEWSLFGEKTRWFDTYPSADLRAHRAEQASLPGSFGVEVPARVLFQNFDEVSERVSLRHYQQVIGPVVQESHLVQASVFDHALGAPELADEALERLLQGASTWWAPLPVPSAVSPPDDLDDTKRRLITIRERMTLESPALRMAAEQAEDAWLTRSQARVEGVLCEAKLSSSKLQGTSAGEAASDREERIRASNETLLHCRSRHATFERRLTERIALAMGTLVDDRECWRGQLKSSPGPEIETLLSTGSKLNATTSAMQSLRSRGHELSLLLEAGPDLASSEIAQARIQELCERLCASLEQLKVDLGPTEWPFRSGLGPKTLAASFVPRLPSGRKPKAVARAVAVALQRADHLSMAILSRLAYFTEVAEAGLELGPLDSDPRRRDDAGEPETRPKG
ncbi:MAG: M48 family metalloprotease, partial [Planctomycetes bacterium]|nr:M48 family metalloprotease [Planctomycetota bacterium]